MNCFKRLIKECPRISTGGVELDMPQLLAEKPAQLRSNGKKEPKIEKKNEGKKKVRLA